MAVGVLSPVKSAGESSERIYELVVGNTLARERFVQVRRPMFYAARLLDRHTVIGLPKPGTKTGRPVAFALSSGRELEGYESSEHPEALDSKATRKGQGRSELRVTRSAVGKPSSLVFLNNDSADKLSTVELPDAISTIASAPFGYLIGCRDGHLYAFDREGQLRWRWQTPGSDRQSPASLSQAAYFRPCPYRLESKDDSVLVASWANVWAVDAEGHTLWHLNVNDLAEPDTRTVVSGALRLTFNRSLGGSVSFLREAEDDWVVGTSGGLVLRLDERGKVVSQAKIARSQTFPIAQSDGSIVAFGSQPKLWFVDAPAPVYLPEKYQWPFTFIGSYGEYVVAHRRGDRHVGLITSSGDLAVQVRCPRSITDVQVAEEALVSLQAA